MRGLYYHPISREISLAKYINSVLVFGALWKSNTSKIKFITIYIRKWYIFDYAMGQEHSSPAIYLQLFTVHHIIEKMGVIFTTEPNSHTRVL